MGGWGEAGAEHITHPSPSHMLTVTDLRTSFPLPSAYSIQFVSCLRKLFKCYILTVAARGYSKAGTDVQSQDSRSMIFENITVRITRYMLTVTTSSQICKIAYILTYQHTDPYTAVLHLLLHHTFCFNILYSTTPSSTLLYRIWFYFAMLYLVQTRRIHPNTSLVRIWVSSIYEFHPNMSFTRI
jgi:hypothetical protein